MRGSTAWLAVAVLAAGATVLFLAHTAGDDLLSLFHRRWRRYKDFVAVELSALYLPFSASGFALRHALFFAATFAVGVWSNSWPLLLLLLTAGAAAPLAWLKRERRRRQAALEAQLDTTLQSLASTILVTQNLEDAFQTIATQFDPPVSQEADVLVKELRLGTSVDEALRHLGERCRSRSVDAVVTALTVGRQTGGELPKVLETTAKVLRETRRVEGVMESKTSEGKAQALVMGVVPIVFAVMLQVIDPSWMYPLFHDPIGWAVLALAGLLEIAGVLLVRKFSTVDV